MPGEGISMVTLPLPSPGEVGSSVVEDVSEVVSPSVEVPPHAVSNEPTAMAAANVQSGACDARHRAMTAGHTLPWP
jgi:hypothetical protein